MYKTLKKFYKLTINNKKRLYYFLIRRFTNKDFIKFQCNICGKTSVSPRVDVWGRETSSCYHCGSTLRFRSLISVLSKELYMNITVLKYFPINKSITGIGMSDSDNYSRYLSRKFNYTNTFYHKEPKLDITNINEALIDSFDFIITSDVFEHVSPPVQIAFNNLYKLLKKNGICIFSVPYKLDGDHTEHFPELYDFKIVVENRNKILINKTKEGIIQAFNNIKFHGGHGATLEMRVFSKNSLMGYIENAGFSDIKFYNFNEPEYGIVSNRKDSLIISLRKT